MIFNLFKYYILINYIMDITLLLSILIVSIMVGVALYFHYNKKQLSYKQYENHEEIIEEPQNNFIDFTTCQHIGWLHDNNNSDNTLILYFDQIEGNFFVLPIQHDNKTKYILDINQEDIKDGNIINYNNLEYTIEFSED